MIDELKKYLKETPIEQLLDDWEKICKKTPNSGYVLCGTNLVWKDLSKNSMARSKLIRDKAKNIIFNRDRNQKRRVNFYMNELYGKVPCSIPFIIKSVPIEEHLKKIEEIVESVSFYDTETSEIIKIEDFPQIQDNFKLTINESISYLDKALNKMMVNFDNQEDRNDFILDVVDCYKEEISLISN